MKSIGFSVIENCDTMSTRYEGVIGGDRRTVSGIWTCIESQDDSVATAGASGSFWLIKAKPPQDIMVKTIEPGCHPLNYEDY